MDTAQRSISPGSLAQELLEAAHGQGFDLAAILRAAAGGPAGSEAQRAGGPGVTPQSAAHYLGWLQQGFHAGMAYLERPDAVAARLHPESLLPGLRSVLMVGINYLAPHPSPEGDQDPARGVIARYAWGRDYHTILKQKLAELAYRLHAAFGLNAAGGPEAAGGLPFASRVCVGSNPLLERDLAMQAGLGFFGKNTCLISPEIGSWFFLGELLLTVDLPPTLSRVSRPRAEATLPSCGRCSRCLQACPTGALVAPYTLDSRRCLSYLTIELKGPLPRELRPLLGNRVFGCDVCQEVCPWNRRFSRPTSEPAFLPRSGSIAPPLLDLLALDEAAFGRRFHGTPLRRAGRRGLLRNVAVALGNWGNPRAVPALAQAMHDAEPLVRGHAAWALGRIATANARTALASALAGEADPWVRAEIDLALAGL